MESRNTSTPAGPLLKSASSWGLRGGSLEVRGDSSRTHGNQRDMEVLRAQAQESSITEPDIRMGFHDTQMHTVLSVHDL